MDAVERSANGPAIDIASLIWAPFRTESIPEAATVSLREMALPIFAHRSTDRDTPTLQESVELRELPSIAGCAIEMAAPTARLRATDASAPINAICEHEKEDDSDT